MKYKIGEVSRILGISPDLLRYYEKKGVVSPEKSSGNSYRYYDAWDINFLMDCLWFKNFGFSIEQISNIVKIPGTGELETLLSGKEEELRETIRRCRLLLMRSEHHRADLRKTETLLHRFEISELPAGWRFINRIGNDYIEGRETSRAAESWLKIIPFNQRCFEMEISDIRPGTEGSCRWGYSLTQQYSEALDFVPEPPAAFYPAKKSLHTVFKSAGGRDGFYPALLCYALEYAEKNGLELEGTVFGVILASVLEKNRFYGFFEAWLPLRETCEEQP